MYHIDPEHAPRPSTPTELEHDSDAKQECDFCGAAIHRETVLARPGGDGGDLVVLCTKCEFGVD